MNEQQTQHRIEVLEGEIRRLRQALRNLSTCVIAGGEKKPVALAKAALILLGDDQYVR